MLTDIRNLTLEELKAQLRRLDVESYRAVQVFEWLYKKGVDDFSGMRNLPEAARQVLAQNFNLKKIELQKLESSRDLTQKFLFCLQDGALIESVSIPAKSRLTACLSTQVGCRFGCLFCASGSLGRRRNLETSEILAQLSVIRANSAQNKVSHIVFMGIGEPLDNYENLLRAIKIINDAHAFHLGIRKMTISTCGLAPAIERLSQEGLEIELSVSLHSAFDEKRGQILPVNKKYPIKVLMEAVKKYITATNRKVTFEYLLLGGYNTAIEDAQGLIRLLRGINCRVNLIAYNQTSARLEFQQPTKLEVLFFRSYLSKKGLEVTLRVPRGQDISAACGQLKTVENFAKGDKILKGS